MKDKLNSNNTERIKQITQEIACLSRELERLLIQEENSSTQDIIIGDQVVITNSYKGLRHARGTVVKVTEKQASIKLESGCIVQRAKRNLTRLENGSPSEPRR